MRSTTSPFASRASAPQFSRPSGLGRPLRREQLAQRRPVAVGVLRRVEVVAGHLVDQEARHLRLGRLRARAAARTAPRRSPRTAAGGRATRPRGVGRSAARCGVARRRSRPSPTLPAAASADFRTAKAFRPPSPGRTWYGWAKETGSSASGRTNCRTSRTWASTSSPEDLARGLDLFLLDERPPAVRHLVAAHDLVVRDRAALLAAELAVLDRRLVLPVEEMEADVLFRVDRRDELDRDSHEPERDPSLPDRGCPCHSDRLSKSRARRICPGQDRAGARDLQQLAMKDLPVVRRRPPRGAARDALRESRRVPGGRAPRERPPPTSALSRRSSFCASGRGSGARG